MRYPKFLKPGGTIGLVAPSFGCTFEPYASCMNAAEKYFESEGYTIVEGPNCRRDDGIGISSTPENCGRELTEFYQRNDNDVLFTCGGGELMCETIDYVDFFEINDADPKWFMGYSDNTNFTFLLNTMCDTASIYGPSIGAFGASELHQSHADAMGLVTGSKLTVSGYESYELESLKSEENPYAPYNLTETKQLRYFMGEDEVESVKPFSGRLLGGCLDCLANLVGTQYDYVDLFNERYANDGIIWYLECCDLGVMQIRRALWNLDRAGWFKNASGFIIGRPLAAYKQEMMGLDQYNAVYGIIGRYNVPIVMDADLGHIAPAMPIMSGAYANVKAEGNNITIEHILR